jgi:hypothetical protein
MTAKNSGIEELDYFDRDFSADIDFLGANGAISKNLRLRSNSIGFETHQGWGSEISNNYFRGI